VSGRAPWFSFLVHPRHARDLHQVAGSDLLRLYSADEKEFERRACSMPPQVIGELSFGFEPCHGELVAVARLPHGMVGPGALSDVAAAARMAAGRGSAVLGLGALTSPVTGAGLKLLAHLPPGVTVTTGNAYTAAVVRHNVRQALEAVPPRRPCVAIVGCTGSVGYAATHLLAEEAVDLVLVGRAAARVHQLFPDLAGRATAADDLSALRAADVAVILTSGLPPLTPDTVRPGTVVIDYAQPAGLTPEVTLALRTAGCRVVEGGLVRIPGYESTFDLSLSDPRDTFACLAETYLFARDGIRDHSVGRASPRLAARLESLARRLGVRPTELDLTGTALAAGGPGT
jgi:predicted amino acid dehydrogenase